MERMREKKYKFEHAKRINVQNQKQI